MNLLSEIFWGYAHGVVTKLSSKFGWIWTSFARDSWFEGLFAGFLDDIGQTGGRDRSDRWARPVRPVTLSLNCPTGQTGPVHRSDRSVCAVLRFEKFLSLLLSRCDSGLLLRDSLSIAILADLGSRVCGDFGT